MTEFIAADPSVLNNPALKPFQEHMAEANRVFVAALNANWPVMTHARGETDEEIGKALAVAIQVGPAIMNGLVQLPDGDTNRVRDLSQLLTQVEADNAAAASTSTGKH